MARFQLQRMDYIAPSERRRLLVIGVCFCVVSALFLLVGIGSTVTGDGFMSRASFLVVVGAVGLVFFGPLTAYVVREIVRLRHKS